jgi:hypothetical protein
MGEQFGHCALSFGYNGNISSTREAWQFIPHFKHNRGYLKHLILAWPDGRASIASLVLVHIPLPLFCEVVLIWL